MEDKLTILGSRPINAAIERPEFGFSILEKGALHRHSSNNSNPSRSSKRWEGIEGRDSRLRKSSSFCAKSTCHGEGEKISSTNGSELQRQTKYKKMLRLKTYHELHSRDRGHLDPPLASESRPLIPASLSQELATASNASKLLVNVTVVQSVGALRVLVSKDATVYDVTRAALVLYAKEGRRPLLSSDPASFGLHYSQFSMDSLNPTDRIKDLSARNFFLFPKAPENARMGNVSAATAPSTASWITKIGRVSKITEPWFKALDCFLSLP